jgi:transcriptional regulator with XRE-family HTH domain
MECILSFDEIGQTIRGARKSRNLTQSALAAQLGMSRASISDIENGTVAEIGFRNILSICAALGIELVAQVKTRRPTLHQLMKEQGNA